jgi:alpha-maltose-1-phosphate synthase
MERANSQSVLQVAAILPQDVRQQCRALSQAGLLQTVIGSLIYTEGGAVDRSFKILDQTFGTQVALTTERRRLSAVSPGILSSQVWPELWTRLGKRLGLLDSGSDTADRYLDRIDRAASRRLKSRTQVVVGREDCCLQSFRAARRFGARCLYDLPTTHYQTVRAIMEREHAEFPDAEVEQPWVKEYSPARNSRKDAELAAADQLLVPSQFVRQSLVRAGVAPERISVIPFGCEPVPALARKAEISIQKQTLLYVGHLSVRKGTPRLLKAWRRLAAHRTHTLRLIGAVHLSAKFLADYTGLVEMVPRLPRSELSKHYASSYAFVMPAAAEGFAVVITEALAHGLPVIASENSGAAGFMMHEKEGLLYSFADEEKLCEALERVLSRPDEVAEMSARAVALAERWTWQQYREAFLRLIQTLMAIKPAHACDGRNSN